jgi:beta-N-acetylhexosaminidase
MSSREFRRSAGQLAIVGFAGGSIPADVRRLAKEFDLGGVIFFARNVESPEQVAELSREARELARELPLWVSVDQEGGRVARLKSPFTVWPPMITLGRSGDGPSRSASRAPWPVSSRRSGSTWTTRRCWTS